MWVNDDEGDDDDDITLTESLCARKVSVSFICMNSFDPYNNSMKWVVSLAYLPRSIQWVRKVKKLVQGHPARK